jgi:hypothetical protein
MQSRDEIRAALSCAPRGGSSEIKLRARNALIQTRSEAGGNPRRIATRLAKIRMLPSANFRAAVHYDERGMPRIDFAWHSSEWAFNLFVGTGILLLDEADLPEPSHRAYQLAVILGIPEVGRAAFMPRWIVAAERAPRVSSPGFRLAVARSDFGA